MKAVGHTHTQTEERRFPSEDKILLEETHDYIYINGSLKTGERCFCLMDEEKCLLFGEDEGHLKVIRVQKYQVLFRKLLPLVSLHRP